MSSRPAGYGTFASTAASIISVGRILVAAGNTPISVEAMESLGESVRDELGEDHAVSTSGPFEERGAAPIEPNVYVILDGIQTTAALAAAVAAAVTAWRNRTKSKERPRSILRVVLEELDAEGNRRRVWVEEDSGGSDEPSAS